MHINIKIKDKKTIRKLLKLKGRKESKVNCIYNIFLLLVGGNWLKLLNIFSEF